MRWALAALCFVISGCRLSCLGPSARLVDAPIAQKLTAPVDPSASKPFDHGAFDVLLQRFARADEGRVDYAGLAGQKAALDAYLATLADAPLQRLTSDERKALLINAYNAFTLALILENYPGIESIKDLASPWKARRWRLGGEVVSLDDIEHGLLRPLYKDPRIHFAVNCASVGCPPLQPTAYVGAKLDEQLDAATRATLRNPRYADVAGGRLRLTAIMNWYGNDFIAPNWAPRADSLTAFVGIYVAGIPADAPVSFLDYDWRLNDISR